jgi:abhydrolase domain-containing protein 12
MFAKSCCSTALTISGAINVAKVPPERIVILGQSLGTAVTAAVVEHYAQQGVDFAGVVLVAGFTSLTELLPSYSIAGWLPILSPLKSSPLLLRLWSNYVVDKWPSATRIANFVRLSKRVRLFIVHARDDFEIPWTNAEGLFLAAANATTKTGMEISLLEKMKSRNTINMGDGAFISTWKSGDDKIIREEIVAYGRKLSSLLLTPTS